MCPRKIKPFIGGKVVNVKGKYQVDVEGTSFTFKVDKNLSVYDVEPRKISLLGETFDCLSPIRGQVPHMAQHSLAAAYSKWVADINRFN